MSATFIKERPLPIDMKGPTAAAATQRGKVTVDDGVAFLAHFDNGAMGTFEATRFATGRKNYERFEMNGSRGSLVFNLERMNELQFYSLDDAPHLQGFRTILVTESVHPYVSAWWPPGHGLGYEHTFTHAVADLLNAVAEDRMPQPDFAEGVRVQAVLEAVEESWAQKKWVQVKE
jgi:predicted dehydrogenase